MDLKNRMPCAIMNLGQSMFFDKIILSQNLE